MKSCKWCLSDQHTSLMCFKKPRKYIKSISDKSYNKSVETKLKWFEINPGPEWTCYLNISNRCPVLLDRRTLVLEHVKPKVRYPELKYSVDNLLPACTLCNEIKGSHDLEELIERYPHLENIVKLRQ